MKVLWHQPWTPPQRLLADARECLDVLSDSEWRNGLEEVTYYLEGLLNKCRR